MGIKSKIISLAVAATLTAGCASSPSSMTAAYVDDNKYSNYTCEQIKTELERVIRRRDQLHAKLERESKADKAQMAIGLVLFWPALFFLEGGDGAEAEEYKQLMGDADALQVVAIRKQCK